MVTHGSVRRWCVLAGTLALVVVLPLRASAQSQIDFAAGYSMMHDSDAETNFPFGWFASVGKTVTPMWAIVGDISGNYKRLQAAPGVDVKLRVHTFMAGPKLYARQGQMTPWAQLLLGAASLSGSAFGIGASETDFAFQPGGGIDFDVQNNFGVRFGGNMRFIRSSGSTVKEFQFIAGVVFRGR